MLLLYFSYLFLTDASYLDFGSLDSVVVTLLISPMELHYY